MKSKILIGLVLGGGFVVNLVATEVYWEDVVGLKHKSNIVSQRIAGNMVVRVSQKKVKPRETRIIIKQGWGCLSISSGWWKQGYRKIDNNTAILNVGLKDFIGADLGFRGKAMETDVYVLGKKGCKLLNNSEHWTVKQEVKGKWETVGEGVFVFKE